MIHWLRWVAFAALLGAAGLALSQNLPDLGDTAQSDLSPQAERRIGESIMRQIRRDPDFIEDPEITEYVQAVGQSLAAVSPDRRQEFDFFVVRDNTVNAFALPGGFIGVHSGLIVTSQSESEFASVMAHEIAHVVQRHLARQLETQNKLSVLSLAGLALAILAARSNPQIAQAAAIGSQAVPVSAFLSYSRDFEREADRVGYQILESGGFDVHGMPTFFERLQKSTRLYDNNAPTYLRTHPLTSERIADMQNRAGSAAVRQRADSTEFTLVRAKLRAGMGTPDDAVKFFREALGDRRFASERAVRYGYAVALERAKDFKGAERELAPLRQPNGHPMFESLEMRILMGSGDYAAAERAGAAALQRYPQNVALQYLYAETLQQLGRHKDAIAVLSDLARQRPREARPHNLLAKSYSALGQRLAQHRALAEYYYLQGSLPAAIQQLQLAQSSGDGDFYSLSAVDARLRELRALQLEEAKLKR